MSGAAKEILAGAATCTGGMFLAAPVVALLYRLPTWPNGSVSGMEALAEGFPGVISLLMEVWLNVMFFGIIGGFVLLAVLGVLIGLASHVLYGERPEVRRMRTLCGALAADFLVALVLGLLADRLAPLLYFSS